MAKSNAEIRKLWEEFRETEDEERAKEIRETLIVQYRPLVRYTAERLKGKLPACVDIQEMISAGQIGLINAVDKFEPERGILFQTYCSPRIRGAILDDLREGDWVPRLIRSKANRLAKVKLELAFELGREPEDTEIARRMRLSMLEYDELLKEVDVRMQIPIEGGGSDGSDDREMQRIELIEDRSQVQPLENLSLKEIREVATRGLSMKERRVLTMYYFDSMTMKEIGAIMRISESRVCQIHGAVMKRLRDRFGIEPPARKSA